MSEKAGPGPRFAWHRWVATEGVDQEGIAIKADTVAVNDAQVGGQALHAQRNPRVTEAFAYRF